MIAFVCMLFLIGLPLFFLEISIAQYSKFGPLEVWKIVPMVRGLKNIIKKLFLIAYILKTYNLGIGICSLFIAAFISLYYNVLICYSLIYAISSFLPTLPWTSCNYTWNDAKCCLSSVGNFSKICPKGSESPAKQYFKYSKAFF